MQNGFGQRTIMHHPFTAISTSVIMLEKMKNVRWKYINLNITEHFQGVIEYKGVILETSKEGGDGQYEATTYQGGPPESTSYQVLPELNAPPKNTEFRHTDIPKTDVKTDYLSVMTTVAKNGADESNRNNVLPDKSFQSFGKIDSSAGSFFDEKQKQFWTISKFA